MDIQHNHFTNLLLVGSEKSDSVKKCNPGSETHTALSERGEFRDQGLQLVLVDPPQTLVDNGDKRGG